MSAGIQVSEVRIGAHSVHWGPSGSESEVGLTDEGCKFVIEHKDYEVTTEEYGIMPINTIRLGERVTCQLMLKQFENQQLRLAIPGSVDGTGASVTSWNFGKQAGVEGSGTAQAKRLRLHPILTAATDTTQDLILHKAVVIEGPFEVEYRNRKERMFGVTFLALPDTTQVDGKLLGRWKTDA